MATLLNLSSVDTLSNGLEVPPDTAGFDRLLFRLTSYEITYVI